MCALSSAPRLLHMHALHAHGRHPMQLSAGALIACLIKEMSSVGSAKHTGRTVVLGLAGHSEQVVDSKAPHPGCQPVVQWQQQGCNHHHSREAAHTPPDWCTDMLCRVCSPTI